MTADELLLLERAVSANRARGVDGDVKPSPAWNDLDRAGRRAVFDETLRQRSLERAADTNGLSSTIKTVLERLR